MQPTLHEAAYGFLLAHQGEHLHHDQLRLVSRCADHLLQHHDITNHRAHVVAMQAMGELASRGNAAQVDMTASTSFAVFVRDPAIGIDYAFTAAELLALAKLHAATRARAIH